jgi:hypothetical protein
VPGTIEHWALLIFREENPQRSKTLTSDNSIVVDMPEVAGWIGQALAIFGQRAGPRILLELH